MYVREGISIEHISIHKYMHLYPHLNPKPTLFTMLWLGIKANLYQYWSYGIYKYMVQNNQHHTSMEKERNRSYIHMHTQEVLQGEAQTKIGTLQTVGTIYQMTVCVHSKYCFKFIRGYQSWHLKSTQQKYHAWGFKSSNPLLHISIPNMYACLISQCCYIHVPCIYLEAMCNMYIHFILLFLHFINSNPGVHIALQRVDYFCRAHVGMCTQVNYMPQFLWAPRGIHICWRILLCL